MDVYSYVIKVYNYDYTNSHLSVVEDDEVLAIYCYIKH